jgi:hypothetical protein
VNDRLDMPHDGVAELEANHRALIQSEEVLELEEEVFPSEVALESCVSRKFDLRTGDEAWSGDLSGNRSAG